MPALFIRMSVPPKRARTALSNFITASRRLTSTSMVITLAAPPGAAFDNCASAFVRRSAPISAMATFMPKRANRIAAASPMPEGASGDDGDVIGRHGGGRIGGEELAESDIELLPGEKKPQSSQAWMIA